MCYFNCNGPQEDVRALLSNPLYDQKVTYLLGSALNIDDLKRARCDIAECMFFLADIKADDALVAAEDAATVLRALSVSNFNPQLKCLVQVLKPEERVILRDNDIGVILCLEEYKQHYKPEMQHVDISVRLLKIYFIQLNPFQNLKLIV